MRFRGVSQIVLFNWPFFACATFTVLLALFINPLLPDKFQLWVWAAVAIGSTSVVLSLIASWYAYDLTQPYSFKYLSGQPPCIANIHAGFDESSLALKQRFPGSIINTFDFYDPQKHTEASIRRARNRYSAPVPTTRICTNHISIGDDSFNAICLIFAAHEIRDSAERIAFFQALKTTMKPIGNLYVVEHLLDWRNALVYSIGSLHFHTEKTWENTFSKAGWQIVSRKQVNGLVVCYQLQCNFT